MAEPQTVTGFDKADRERTQVALRRYMEEHGIGTPTLQVRIIDADEPRHREIPLSTLQRFITGSHHTQDHHVAVCHAFVSELAYYGEGRETAALGGALFAFLQGTMQDDDRAALITTVEEKFARAYETRTRPATQGGAIPYPPETDLIDSHISFEALPGKPYLRAREFVPDLANLAEFPDRRFPFDGVLLFAAPLVYVFLRNSLTRQPKIYTLGQVPKSHDGQDVLLLEGEAFDTRFLRERPAQRLSNNFRVQFIPRAEEGPEA